MKKIKLLGMVIVIILVIAGCTSKTKNMKNEEAMAKDKMEETMDDSKTKSDDMNGKKDSESEQKDTMKDQETVEDKSNHNDMTEEKVMDEVMKNKGEDAPGFELVDTNGNTHKLTDYKGEKVYIKFWASWCSICLAGLDEVDELAGEESEFKVLTIVSPGFSGEKKSDNFTKWFNGLNKTNMPVLLDEGGKIAKAYGVRGYPTSAYIGSDGILVKKLPGHNSNNQIKESFNAIH